MRLGVRYRLHGLPARHRAGGVLPVIAVATSATQLERAMRRRRIAKIVLAILFAVIWIPVAIVMLVAGTSDRRR